jgi:hypothetical protein
MLHVRLTSGAPEPTALEQDAAEKAGDGTAATMNNAAEKVRRLPNLAELYAGV